jgi:hypothetical protein
MATDKATWVWLPHPSHFICAAHCRFHLATCVGDFIVSTVGEYVPPEGTREVLAACRGIVLEGKGDARERDWLRKVGFEDIGHMRKYETMVFHAVPAPADAKCGCRFHVGDWLELYGVGANDPEEAYRNHMTLCEEWAGKTDADKLKRVVLEMDRLHALGSSKTPPTDDDIRDAFRRIDEG